MPQSPGEPRLTKSVILFRSHGTDEATFERAAALKHFDVITQRTHVEPGSLVIPRYSALPYRNELEEDIHYLGATLANDARGHSWIADFDWYHDLKLFTPKTWDEREFPLCDHPGPFVVKGRTNSRKNAWSRRMFAKDKAAAISVGNELFQDPEIASQGIVYREFVPLVRFEFDVNGMPITNEWRFFFWRTRRLAHGYYWSNASDEAKSKAKIDYDGISLAQKAARIAAEHANFFVIDVAEKRDGGWTVIEVNSGEQAGLSEIDPDEFYRALREAVDFEAVIDLCEQCGVPEGDQHWMRASGECLCVHCGKTYSRHPMDEVHVGMNGALWLHRLCDGSLVKT